jgi:hypothetical protein
MPNRPSPLTREQRRRFGQIISTAQRSRGLTYQDLADDVARILNSGDGPDWGFFQHLCSGPPRPLSNTTWLDATLQALGLTWHDVLVALDCKALEEWRREPGIDAAD